MDGRPAEPARRLVVLSGEGAGAVIDVPPVVSLVGRDEGADIRLPWEGVSRRHLVLDAAGPAVVVVDQQSRNGTWVNGRRFDGPVVLHDGDVLTVGPVRLRFDDDGMGMAATGGHDAVGVPHGDAYASQRDQFIAAGNQTWNQTIQVRAEDDDTAEIFEGRGPGRVVAIVGVILVVVGFGWAAYTLFSTAAYQGPGIPEFPVQFGYAFGVFVLGGFLTAIGSGISRARRRREGG
ncbi:MAG TPA: FHA domain-containing protein [Agromyces sp.]